MKGISQNDLQFREFASYVHRALQARRYVRVDAIENADVMIMLSYGTSDPNVSTQTYALPITQYVQGREYETETSVHGGYGYGPPLATARGTVKEKGRYETGYVPVTQTLVSYGHVVVLRAYGAPAVLDAIDSGAPSPPELWRTGIVGVDSRSDLRRLFPVLIGGGLKYIGKNTQGQVEFRVSETAPAVRYVRGDER